MKTIVTLLMMALVPLLASCAATTARDGNGVAPAETAAPPVAPPESILEYAGRILALSPEGQKEELTRVNERLALNRVNFNDRTKAALIYALADSPEVRDTVKAQTLLDELARDKDPDLERSTLTRIVRDYLAETSRLGKENKQLSSKMHDEQKRADNLQLKLEELKKIEKTIVDRKVLDK